MPAAAPAPSSFSVNLTRFVEKTKTKADEVIRAVALELLGGVIEKSPVDTGFFRANWRVAIGTPDLSTEGKGVVETQQFKVGAKSSLERKKADRAAAEGKEFKPAARKRAEKRETKLAQSAAETLAKGTAAAIQGKLGDVIHVTNNTEYAEALENGHSGQAPSGVMKITFEEVRHNLNTLVEQAGAA